MLIRDFERDAVLAGERGTGTWKEKRFGDLDRDPSKLIGNQLGHLSGLTGKVWLREDGAVARMPSGNSYIIFELPQAQKYEAELEAIKEQKARESVPKF